MVEWTGLGPGLLLRLDRSARDPLRIQLEREVREAIRAGHLSPGERLPSSRSLAAELGISRGLVTECYAQLQAEGFLTAASGSSTRVAPRAITPREDRGGPAAAERTLRVDFRPGVPDLTSFPRRDWAWALREACRVATPNQIGYGDPRGVAEARAVISSYLRRVRGADAEPERIIVCSGFAQGVNLALRALATLGIWRIGVEDPGDPDYEDICRRHGMEVVPVGVDEHGIDVGDLAATGVRAVVLTPTHQFPTGVVLSPERRRELIRWAGEQGAYIVEDDYDAEFRYDRTPVGALQGLDPEHVILIGTTSKSLGPALRLAWMTCPPLLIDPLVEDKRLADRGGPALEQLALARLIEAGRYDKHLRRMRRSYGARRDVLRRAVADWRPGRALGGLAAGFHCVANLSAGTDEADVVARAAARGVGVYGMGTFRLSARPWPAQLVLGFGNLSEPAIQQGIGLIGELL